MPPFVTPPCAIACSPARVNAAVPWEVFGGLSYTTFDYRELRVETPVVGSDGARAGTEVVQLYVRDLVGSVTRPVKELKGFQRITPQPGEERMVRFDVPAGELGCIGLDMRYAVEPGAFKVWVGRDSTTGMEGQFEVR